MTTVQIADHHVTKYYASDGEVPGVTVTVEALT